MKKTSPPSPGQPLSHGTSIDSPLMEREPMRVANKKPKAQKHKLTRRAQTNRIFPYSDQSFLPSNKDVVNAAETIELPEIIEESSDRFSNLTDLDKVGVLSDAELSMLRRLEDIRSRGERRKKIKFTKQNKDFNEPEIVKPSQLEINIALTDLLDRMNVKGDLRAQSIANYYNAIAGINLAPLVIQPHVTILDDVPKWVSVKDTGISPRAFIETAYKDYLGKGLTQADIHRRDKDLYKALHNWLRKKENTLDGLQLPTKAEARRQQLEGRTPEELRAIRGLANSAAYKLG